MKKIFLLIQFAALTAGVKAFAIAGGPFDNGDYSILNERNGFYEASYSFKNGSGYSLWTADNLQAAVVDAAGQIIQNVGQGSLLTQNTSTNNGNRTVLYYKGVTYFGGALGEVDLERRTIQGFANASSDFSTSVTTTQQNNSFFTATSSTQFSTATVVSSGRSYTANLNWTGKITETSPQLRFTGSGELAIIAPNGNETIAGLAYGGYSQLIDSIAASIGNLFNGDVALGGNVNPYQDAANAINFSLQSLIPYLQGTGPSNSFAQSEVSSIRVSGYRRFF